MMNQKLKVISGGQTGADIAGLWAAKLYGIPTGGWAPNGFMTTLGSKPELAETFGLKEHVKGYRARTISNLRDSDLTIICCNRSVSGPGSRLTRSECIKHNIPHINFAYRSESFLDDLYRCDVRGAVNMIEQGACTDIPFVLNVAGNSSASCPRAFEFTFQICKMIFSSLDIEVKSVGMPFELYKDRFS